MSDEGYVSGWQPKTLREKLCQQQSYAPDDETAQAISRLINILDRHRPLGPDGKHGDLHTPTCGCDREQDNARAERAEAALQRVRELHTPHRCQMSTRHTNCSINFDGGCSRKGKCQVCRVDYPCATVEAVFAALDGERND